MYFARFALSLHIKMRVLIVNTSERTGGAAVAAHRLMSALNNNGVKAQMLVRDKQTDDISVVPLKRSPLLRWHFLWERFVIFCRLQFQRKHLFNIDIANSGTDITQLKEFKEADIIHLHWVNQGMLSLGNIKKILQSGKPVVWTMHDMWPATSICHLTLGCQQFMTQCTQCRYLPGGDKKTTSLSMKVWRRKAAMLTQGNIVFVACSRWLEGEARKSALLKGQKVTSIPNAIDTRTFRPGNAAAVRESLGLPQDKLLLLFVCQRVTNVNKGMHYLAEACRTLAQQHPELSKRLGLVLLGGHADEVSAEMTFDTYPMGYVGDETRIANIYQACDVFVLPSLSENLPNTIMEAMACGLPCIGFRVGGIPEEIDHKKNGYVAEYCNSDDLARGIHWILCEADREKLSATAINKVCHNFSQSSVALRYSELYQEILAQKHFNL